MTSRLDELFSPDRLRQNWQNSLTSEIVPTQNSANLDIHRQYLELQQLITEKIPGAAQLSVKLADLTEAIDLAFGLDATVPADIEQKEVIVSMLEELEELLSAIELPRWGV